MEKTLHYCTLFLVITFGVTSGNLLSNYISARVVAYQAKVAIEELNQETQIKNTQRQQRLEEERRKTSKGRQLLRSCVDWKNADSNLNSESSKRNMIEACDNYVRYITYGR